MYQFHPIVIPEAIAEHSKFKIRIYKIILNHKVIGWVTNQFGDLFGKITENHWRIFGHHNSQLQPWDIEAEQSFEEVKAYVQTLPAEKFFPPSKVYITVLTAYGQHLYASAGEYGAMNVGHTPVMWDEKFALARNLQKDLEGFPYMTLIGDRVIFAEIARLDGQVICNTWIDHPESNS